MTATNPKPTPTPPPPEAQTEAPIHPLNTKECTIAFLAIVGWVLVFLCGLVVDSKPIRMRYGNGEKTPAAKTEAMNAAGGANANTLLASTVGIGVLRTDVALRDATRPLPPDSAFGIAWDFIVIGFCYTVTNLAILACLASLLGAFGQLANLDRDHPEQRPVDRTNPYLSAAIRGILVYLVFLSGNLVLIDEPFADTNASSYFRLAAVVSLAAFMVSYNPTLLRKILDDIEDTVQGAVDAAGQGVSATKGAKAKADTKGKGAGSTTKK